MFKKIGKLSFLFAAAIFTSVALFGSLLLAAPASAQIPVSVTANAPQAAKDVMSTIFQGVKTALTNAIFRTISYAMQKFAYDSAVWLASGGEGQNPFANTRGFAGYLQDTADQAAGQGLEALGQPFGLNLCQIPNIQADLNMKIGLRNTFSSGPQVSPANCTFSQFLKNWGDPNAWRSKYGSAQALTRQFNVTLSKDDSDLGVQLSATEKINNQIHNQAAGASLQRQEGQGVNPKTTPISGQIQTPSQLLLDQYKSVTPQAQAKNNQQQMNAAIGTGDIKVLPTVLSIFLNTLASSMITNYEQKGMLPLAGFFHCGSLWNGQPCPVTQTGTSGATSNPNAEGAQPGGLAAAEAFFESMQPVNITVPATYDILSQLGNCPASPGIYNCRANDQFISAVKQSETGNPLTIDAALANGNINPQALLIPPDSPLDKDPNCYQNNFCFDNIKVLVQARILPLGFEIAAQESNPDHPWTVGQVEKGFYNCPSNLNTDPNAVPSPSFPFCHLIDPNWVLKAPAANCAAEGPGESLLTAGGSQRLSDCVDLQSCVVQNADGSCALNANGDPEYGYCTREKNIWNFGQAQECRSAEYATCKTFQNSATGASASYLYRTIDTGFCSANTVGCSAYSLSQDANGNWQAPEATYNAASGTFSNTNIFFNNQLDTATCSANSAGCSAFVVDSSSSPLIYLRKAPDYLQCYDTNTATAKIDWPQTEADLSRLTTNPACQEYSQACVPDEVGCDWYTPVSGGGPRVPGKFTPHQINADGTLTWNDECDASCVGYAAYEELPSNYSSGTLVAYIIPSSGEMCSSADVGCSGFTNLATSTNGVETTEYYSNLRQCVTPAENPGKTFITYEGSAAGGYQLQTFTLVADASGAPAYYYRTPEESNTLDSECTADTYASSSLANPDCRQFNDSAGHIYYRLLSRTIPVDAECTPYRLDSTELYNEPSITSPSVCESSQYKGHWDIAANGGQGACQLCFEGGEYRNGSCYYNGLPSGVQNSAGMSATCSASVDSCREFRGNAGTNIQDVFTDDPSGIDTFEPVGSNNPLQDWSTAGVTLSTESTHSGEHSLEFAASSANGVVSRTMTLLYNNQYDLTFWAKGSPATVNVALSGGGLNVPLGSISVGNSWQAYHLGPSDFNLASAAVGATTSAQLSFSVSSAGQLFLDNVRLERVNSDIYLVKNSVFPFNTDPTVRAKYSVCDSHPDDNLPGEALGCSAYQNSTGQTVDLTNFSNICRENAIGCTALFDTKNTLTLDNAGNYSPQPQDAKPEAYNVWLYGSGGSTMKVTLGSDSFSCTVPVGQTGCYTNIMGHSAAEINQLNQANQPSVVAMDTSTVYVGADTPSSSPIYLVASQEATCSQLDLGCTYAGVPVTTPTGTSYVTTTIRNDPAQYSNDLCQSEAVGCSQFTTNGTDNYYFKDPQTNGGKLCKYVPSVTLPGGTTPVSGWFWDGVGECSNNGTNVQNCKTDSDCSNIPNSTCSNIGDIPCYPNYVEPSYVQKGLSYVQQGGTSNYGLWSFGNQAEYQGFVGECPTDQNMCTEFVDHSDNNQAYFYIKDDKINPGDCNGQVSQTAGCALFDEVDNPNKYYNTAALYSQSAANQSQLVPAPETNDQGNDANIIIKVTPDRTCGEWLQCATYQTEFNPYTGKNVKVCADLVRYKNTGTGPTPLTLPPGQSPLGASTYESRSVSWANMDYDGYSLLDQVPTEQLSVINLSSSTNPGEWRLVRQVACSNNNCLTSDPNSYSCQNNGETCGPGSAAICLNNKCVESDTNSVSADDMTAASCRIYPEADSPFPPTPSTLTDTDFANVHYCSVTTSAYYSIANQCDCEYQKQNFANLTTKYYPVDSKIPAVICVGGMENNSIYSSNSDCAISTCETDGGTCAAQQQPPQTFVGEPGYCLQYDDSRIINGDSTQHPCLTWLPINNIPGATDIYNQYTQAGFTPEDWGYSNSGPYYCEDTSNYSYTNSITLAFKGRIFYGSTGFCVNASTTLQHDGSSVVDFLNHMETEGGSSGMNVAEYWTCNKDSSWYDSIAPSNNYSHSGGSWQADTVRQQASHLCPAGYSPDKVITDPSIVDAKGEAYCGNNGTTPTSLDGGSCNNGLTGACSSGNHEWCGDFYLEFNYTCKKDSGSGSWVTPDDPNYNQYGQQASFCSQVGQTGVGGDQSKFWTQLLAVQPGKSDNASNTPSDWSSQINNSYLPRMGSYCQPFGASSITQDILAKPLLVTTTPQCNVNSLSGSVNETVSLPALGDVNFSNYPYPAGPLLNNNPATQPALASIFGKEYNLWLLQNFENGVKPGCSSQLLGSSGDWLGACSTGSANANDVCRQNDFGTGPVGNTSVVTGRCLSSTSFQGNKALYLTGWNGKFCRTDGVSLPDRVTTQLLSKTGHVNVKVDADKEGAPCNSDFDCVDYGGEQYMNLMSQYINGNSTDLIYYHGTSAGTGAAAIQYGVHYKDPLPGDYSYTDVEDVNGDGTSNSGLTGDNNLCNSGTSAQSFCANGAIQYPSSDGGGLKKSYVNYSSIQDTIYSVFSAPNPSLIDTIETPGAITETNGHLLPYTACSSDQDCADTNDPYALCVAPLPGNPYYEDLASTPSLSNTLSLWDNTYLKGVNHAPQVLAVNDCITVGGVQKCHEDPQYPLTIEANGQTYTNGTVEITNSNPQVGLEFYGYADNDHMPIKRMKIDWGDGTPPLGGGEGYYKNERGYASSTCNISSGGTGKCVIPGSSLFPSETSAEVNENSLGTPLGPITVDNSSCTTDADCAYQPLCGSTNQWWGLDAGSGSAQSGACTTGVFGANGHIYNCTKAEASDNAKAGKCDTQTFGSGGCCIFTPRVQIVDNWDWCNSSDGKGAYGLNPPATDVADGSVSTACDDSSNTSTAWSYFAGTIEVAPNE